MYSQSLATLLVGHLAITVCAYAYPPERAAREGRVVHATWSQIQTMIRSGSYRPVAIVRTGPDGKQRSKARLESPSIKHVPESEEGISISILPSKGSVPLPRSDVYSIRFTPIKNKAKWRTPAALVAVPIGLGAYLLSFLPWGGIPESPDVGKTGFALSAAVALPVAVYMLAQRADRGRNAVHVIVQRERLN